MSDQIVDFPVGSHSAKPKIFSLTAITAWPVMQLQYVGAQLFSKVTVAASGASITVYADDVDGATTSYYTADLSTPAAARDTFGELAAEMNAKADIRCFLIGVLPSESTDGTLAAVTGGDIRTVNGLTLYGNAAVLLDQGFAITNEKFTVRPTGGWATKHVGWERNRGEGVNGPFNVINYLCYLESTITNVNAGTTTIYWVDEVEATSGTLYTAAAYTSATKQTTGATPSPMDPFIATPPGKRLVVKFNIVDTAMSVAVIYSVGLTKHLNGEVVPSANYTGCA